MVKIAVLGAGINGLTCAVKIKEKYKDYDVVLISSEFTPNTTGDGSGGLWYPFICGATPADLIRKWGSETYKYLHELYRMGGHGVSLLPVYSLYRTKEKFSKPSWWDTVYGYHVLVEQQLKDCNQLAGHTFLTFASSAQKLLAYLQERFERANGRLLRAKITSLQDPLLEAYDVVVNCTGLGARWLVPDDAVVPVRGQITKNAEVVSHWVGLRPARHSIRLEPEEKNGKLYIHNYGHGGSGFTLFWGCGDEVLQILQRHLDRNEQKNQILSKL
ncbi:hypothetical protein HF086_009260 [Spodoptera exigua]|uniref:FAD dependent oxidoreductase domain-containing protein n=1 Tax=Spodoptera exigua TaxID=7107 RepID=A0A922SF66_SPOEX|nr:hypothetical protein HF086_009260 [Spodoptera exigua]